jgi:hypothetical protein
MVPSESAPQELSNEWSCQYFSTILDNFFIPLALADRSHHQSLRMWRSSIFLETLIVISHVNRYNDKVCRFREALPAAPVQVVLCASLHLLFTFLAANFPIWWTDLFNEPLDSLPIRNIIIVLNYTAPAPQVLSGAKFPLFESEINSGIHRLKHKL